ncbi:hypothetical protein HME9304_01933 [Flagellimonas maritima]|uniref:DUF8202 domain-containing protein n=1 Tax=Flagellimonas maritima TaxID=1383885 RepID=A0A2Z4LUG3_9FLAO|nr:T9SS type B sorting domain-containing protein [Allomuricauda aurantiaca]AWX44927.1 hypothetical protein HME9304_01933 [Allomuricauda aurantiaca]
MSTQLLKNLFNSKKTLKRKSHPAINILRRIFTLVSFISLFILCTFQTNAQQLDTWFTADRAVNSEPLPTPGQLQLFTPYAPADGTPVNIWYDFVDFTAQDGVPHPAPADYPAAPPTGFDYPFGPGFLSPAGSIAGIPTLRRNRMNFNPAVEFDGSGDGEALHFRSNSRNNITVIVVFEGLGAGNSAETQRLLFGGDVDTHLSGRTNISLGLSNGNRFSVGRTWLGDGGGFFESGNIDLLGSPTIGVFTRNVIGFEEERLITKVNGIPDIATDRSDITADQELFYFNRLGKHFNSNDSNRNFSGDIAEVLFFDGVFPEATYVQRAESYLAIKYGITLNGAGALGSIAGNTSYNYLAADGTVIWQAMPSPYIYDIAGIGKDRFADLDGGIPNNSSDDRKLRYNLHQRISKSVNTEAIVTVSTNSNFGNDNLDDTRTPVDTGVSAFSTRHNYLVWGNDHASLSETVVELPLSGDVDSRISREWKVQMSNSAGLSPIPNVSVSVDLSGSDILANDACAIHLMIDTDGDGDFTTGPITYITATSIIGTNAFFDNVNFEDEDVFSIAYGDFTPPTASNPASIDVCDTVPAPDPDVVIDEADNCAVDTVVHLNDVSNGGSNPEIITRTYRITDTSGNFIDVEQTINVYTSPNITDLADPTACDSYTLPPISGSNLTGNEAYFSESGGMGTQYNEDDVLTASGTYYIYDETGTTPNCSDEESFILTIISTPTVSVTASSDPTTCGGSDGSIALQFTDVPPGNYTITYFDGAADQDILNVPVAADSATLTGLSAGTYEDIRITVSGCASAADGPDVTLSDPETPTVSVTASSDPTTCGGSDGSIALQFTDVPPGNYTITYFDGAADQDILNVPVAADSATLTGLSAGTYEDIRITVSGCASAADGPDVTLSDPETPTVSVTASSDPTTCGGSDGSIALQFTDVPPGNYTITYFDGAADQDILNVPVAADSATLTGLSAGTYEDIRITVSGCASAADGPDVTLSDPETPTVSVTASSDPTTCGGSDGSIALQFTDVPPGNYTITYFDGAADQDILNVPVAADSATLTGLSAGTYEDIRITVSGCASAADGPDVTLSDPETPTVSVTASSDPTTCGGSDGSIALQFTDVPPGNYTITYFDGAADQDILNVPVAADSATLTGLSAGTYEDIRITVSGCASAADGPDVTLSDPETPTVSVTASSDPTTCGGSDGSIALQFTDVPPGNYTITYFDGAADQDILNVPVAADSATLTGLSAGTYEDIRITVSGCASAADGPDVTLSDPETPTVSVTASSDPTTCGGSDGSIALQFTDVPPGNYTITYFDGAADQDILNVPVAADSATLTGLSAGTYEDIRITVSGCASAADGPDVTLSDPETPTVSVTASSDPTTCGGSDGSIALQFTDVPPGNYTITYFDGAADQDILNVPVAADSATLTGLSAGTYEDIRITVSGCASAADGPDVTLSDPETPTVSVTASSDPTTCGGSDGSIALQFTDVPPGNYTITYFDGAADQDILNVPVAADSATLTGLSAGTYEDIRITVSGCASAADGPDVTLSDPETPTVSVTASSDPTTCGGSDGSIALQFTDVPPGNYTITYFDGAADQDILNVPVAADSATLTGLSAGTYEDIRITVSGCASAADGPDVTLSDPETPTVSVTASSDPTTCGGSDGSIALQFTDVPPGNYTITYFDGAADQDILNVPVAADSATLTGLSAGTYEDIRITVSGCASAADGPDVTLSDPETPTVSVTASSDPTTCGGSDGSIALQFTDVPPGNYTITYFDGAADQDILNVPVAADSATLTGLSAGTYEDIRITVSGCASAADGPDVTLSDPETPTVSVTASSDPTTCGGSDGSIALQFTDVPPGNYTITYFDGAADQDILNVPVAADSATLTGLSAGTYEDIRITVSGCASAADGPDVTLSDPETPTVSVTASSDPTTCGGSDGSIALQFTDVPPGNYTITYFDGAADQDILNVPVAADSATLTGLSAGTYEDIRITVSGCASAADGPDVTLSDPETPTVSVTASSDPTTCGGSDGSIALQFTDVPPGNYTITYFDGAADQDILNVPVAADSATLTGLSAGTYEDIRITVSGCASAADGPDVTLSDPETPTVSVTASSDPTTCGGSDGSIALQFTDVPPGNYTITYFDGAADQDILNVPVAADSATLTGLSAGTYEDIRITVSGCASAADGPDVTLSDPVLSISIITQNTLCLDSEDGSVDVSITNGDAPYTVQLNSGADMMFQNDSFTIDNLAPGNYDISVTSNNGCSSESSFEIFIEGPDLSATIDTDYLCSGNTPINRTEILLVDQSISSDVLYAIDSTNPADFVLSPVFNDLAPGSHFAAILHTDGCLSTIPFEIDEINPLEMVIVKNNEAEIEVTVSGGLPPYTYFYNDNPGTSQNTLTALESGSYVVRVVDSLGCEVFDTTSVDLVDIEIPNFFTPNGDGNNDFWGPRNIEKLPNIETYVFDRYGRKIKIMGQSNNGWDGTYESNPLPSGDYWYTIRLNDGTGREYVGNFTLYR